MDAVPQWIMWSMNCEMFRVCKLCKGCTARLSMRSICRPQRAEAVKQFGCVRKNQFDLS